MMNSFQFIRLILNTLNYRKPTAVGCICLATGFTPWFQISTTKTTPAGVVVQNAFHTTG